MAQIEQRALANGLSVAKALAQQNGGRRAAIGGGLDIHGGTIQLCSTAINRNVCIYMATLSALRKQAPKKINRLMHSEDGNSG
jgi:hypothetical protein